MTTTDWTAETKGVGQYAEVNGLNLYFETRGSGRPLILLHGGLGSGEMFGPVLPALAEHHQVIAPDLQGHGRTADIDRPIDIRLMADDIAALIDHLGLDKPDVVGYSLGGGVALQTAVKYPAKVRRLVVDLGEHPARRHSSRDARTAGPGATRPRLEFLKDTPMYQLYQQVAPRPEDFPRLLDKMGESMAQDFDFSEEVRGLQVPTLIVAADADMAPAEPLRRDLQAARRRPTRRRVDGRGPAEGWSRARDPARPHPLQHRPARRSSPPSPSIFSTLSADSALSGAVLDGVAAAFSVAGRAVSVTQHRFSPGSKRASSRSGAMESTNPLEQRSGSSDRPARCGRPRVRETDSWS